MEVTFVSIRISQMSSEKLPFSSVQDLVLHQPTGMDTRIIEDEDYLLTSRDVTFTEILNVTPTQTNYGGIDAYGVGTVNIAEPQSVGLQSVAPDGTMFWTPDVDPKPQNGMIFPSIDMAWDFYKEYASNGGFEVKKGGEYNPNKTCPNTKYFYCCREGYKTPRSTNSEAKQRRLRPSIRCGCEAKLRINKIYGNQYQVQVFVEKHNHSLVHGNDVHFLRAYRHLDFTQQQFLHQVSTANLGPVKGFKLMKQIYGGFDQIGATANDCKNFRRDMSKFIGDRDAQMVVDKLKSRHEYLTDFYMNYTTNEANCLSGLFWADSEAKRNYAIFGDVISFDATFRSNKYKMVFVPFTGIDNHNRCVTFGAGLISKENVQSYKWLLGSFLEALGKQPNIVVTDQDPAMKQAIEIVFPDSRHRLYMWHIMQKLSSKVGPTLCNNESFKKRICNIVWTDKIGPETFDLEWKSLINDFGLQNNKWLHDMFELRFKWIPAFYRTEPLSGLMRTSSRSESENHFFGQLTNTNLTLVEFLSHFDTAMDAQRYTRAKNDHDTRYTTPDLKTNFPIEAEAVKLYTRTIFYDVQKEIYASLMSCHSVNVVDIDGRKKCVVQHSYRSTNPSNNVVTHEVLYDPTNVTVLCTCNRYERYGLLCRHIFLVLKMFGVSSFPKKYVQKRWSREALLTQSSDEIPPSQTTHETHKDVDAVIRDIHKSVAYYVNRLVTDMGKLELFRDHQLDLMKKADLDVPVRAQCNKDTLMGSLLGVTIPERVDIQIPTDIRNKGTGSHKRMKSTREIAITEASKKFRECGIYHKREGHNRKTCPQLSEASTSGA